ncbi:DUF2141 domain-containing protein [Stutzerimonas tarimensis]|uniref:DUF2141 domain-containing protein n=1 Tax=Stutzerimonas tarimensis TaxID=1507735 RepID=A0ABV7T7N4_9GAMM
MNSRSPLALLALFAASGCLAQTLQVELHEVQHDRGTLRIAVYADPQGFLKPDQAFATRELAAEPGTVMVEFEVGPGRYAVLAYHDEDDNGQLNRRLGMFPAEGYGLSNNPRVMGPPSYEASAFEVADEPLTRVEIQLRY